MDVTAYTTRMRRFWLLLAIVAITSLGPPSVLAEGEVTAVVHARVTSIIDERIERIPGTDTTTRIQTLGAVVLDGQDAGKEIIIENDIIHLRVGDKLFASVTRDGLGNTRYGLLEPDRARPLWILGVLFVGVIVAIGGWQGVRALVSLAATIAIVMYALIPGILQGLPVLAVAVGCAMLMLAIAMYATHGFSRVTHAAFLGTSIAVLVTGLLGAWSVNAARLSGFSAEGSTYVNLLTNGHVDFAALLLGAIIIGAVGVLDDIAMTQAEFVVSLVRVGAREDRAKIWNEAMGVGRAHIGALVNTLALAYAGSALPLLILITLSPASTMLTLNGELIATELVRTAVGSIGLVLTMPLVTALAVWMIVPRVRGATETRHIHG